MTPAAAFPTATSRRPTRIALCGSAGTGKTSLGRRLAAALGYVYVEEGMRKRLEAGFDWLALHRVSGAYESLLDELWSEQNAAQEAALASSAGGFVADRSAYDHAAFWLHYGALHDRARTEAFVGRMLAAAREHDRVLVLPWGGVPLADDGVRSTDRWLQFRFQAIVEGLIGRFAPIGQILHMAPGRTLDQRVADALARLALAQDAV